MGDHSTPPSPGGAVQGRVAVLVPSVEEVAGLAADHRRALEELVTVSPRGNHVEHRVPSDGGAIADDISTSTASPATADSCLIWPRRRSSCRQSPRREGMSSSGCGTNGASYGSMVISTWRPGVVCFLVLFSLDIFLVAVAVALARAWRSTYIFQMQCGPTQSMTNMECDSSSCHTRIR